MSKSSRDNRPYIRPVTRVELNTSNEKRRWIIAGVLLVIGICALAYGFSQALSVQPGWEEVIADTQQLSCAPDFKLMYDFSETGGSAAAVNKALIQCYSDAAARAYILFSSDVEQDGLNNMAYLNRHVNKAVTVEPELYQALSQVVQSGSRQIFLAPAWVEYNRLFLCQNDGEAAQFDPDQNEDVRTYLTDLSVFVDDIQQISIEILGENKICLNVGEDYQTFAETYGIEVFADFGWMRNAFAADLIADALKQTGFTCGYLTSFDGFTRNLDVEGNRYTQNFFDRQGNDVYMPARMHYTAPASIVVLRDYPMTERDRWNYYSFENGNIVTCFLDTRDCMSKSAVANLMAYSKELGCGQMLLEMADAFIRSEALEQDTMTWKEKGIWTIWPDAATLKYNDPELELEMLPENGVRYQKAFQ